MIKVKENSNYIIAFSIGLLAPTFLKMAANFAKQKAEDFKNKSLYSAGI